MTSIRRAALAVVALVTIAPAANAGPIFGGHEYEVVRAEGITWTDARLAALGLGPGWDLATIGSAAENTFVEGLLSTALPERSHFWLGASDSAVEGTWVWLDGTPFVFTDWWGGEPNDVGGEDFLAYDLRSGAWAWNDASNNVSGFPFSRGFVAERPAVPEPATMSLLGLGVMGAALKLRNRRRPSRMLR